MQYLCRMISNQISLCLRVAGDRTLHSPASTNFLNKHKGGMEPSDNPDIPQELLDRVRLNYQNARLNNEPSSNIEEDIENINWKTLSRAIL